MTDIQLTVVSAGLSEPSSTRLLADRLGQSAVARLADAGHDAEVQVLELRELAADIANNLVTGFAASRLRAAQETVTGADGLIAVTPVFSASYSGLFKSFFDVLEPDALADLPVLVAATGGTARHSLVLEHAMRPLFTYLRAVVVPTGVFAASEDWGGTGDELTDTLPVRIERAGAQLATLMSEARNGRDDRTVADSSVVPFEQQLAAVRPDGLSPR